MKTLEKSCFFAESFLIWSFKLIFSNCFWNCVTAISSRFAEK